MNIALKIYAVASANFCSRYVLVRRVGVACALAFAGASVGHASVVGDRDQRDQRDQREAQHQPPPQAAPRVPAQPQAQPQPPAPRQGEAVRPFDAHGFDARAEEQRRALQLQQEQGARSADAARRSGRLTPDERRDLRRQINEAGMDLYPNTPRR